MNSQIDITKLNVEQLKAVAYDVIGRINTEQRNLDIINNRINNLSNLPVDSKPEEKTKEKKETPKTA